MRIEELKNPGTYSGGQQLRARIAHAISFAETVTRYRVGGGTSPSAAAIAALLADAAAKCPGYAGPSLPGTQAVVSNGQTLPVTGGTVTLSVVDGVVTAAYTAA